MAPGRAQIIDDVPGAAGVRNGRVRAVIPDNPCVRRQLHDTGIVLGIAVAIALIAQRWTGLDTPDSSFYASLGLYGDAVTDRAIFTSYYWTRLGVILPNQLLHAIQGTWGGFAAYRFLLILMVTAGTYAITRRFASRPTAAFATALTGLSSVVLSYLGNPYLTGSVLAGTALLIALSQSDRRSAAVGSGVILGWLVMVNPPGVLLAGTVWLVLRLQRRPSAGAQMAGLAIAAGTTLVTFLAFLLAGRAVFPAMDWFGSYISENARIDYRNFASADAVWLRDISLLVPVAVLVIALLTWLRRRDSRAAQVALTTSATSLAFLLIFNPLMGGIPLEAPMYQSMLWPPALIALALSLCALVQERSWTPAAAAIAGIGLAGAVLAGRTAPGLSLAVGIVLAAALVIVFAIGAHRSLTIAVAAVSLVLIGSQLLQNSRGDLGLYYLSPYSWAFASNPIGDRIHTAVNSQEWLLANTRPDDRILDWVEGDWTAGDRELYVVAGMQLWGENRVGLDRTLSPEDIARMNELRPTALALFGRSQEGVLRFWQSIPASNQATVPVCYDYPWAPSPASAIDASGITEGHTCVTRLTW